jgi:hypothetical protein
MLVARSFILHNKKNCSRTVRFCRPYAAGPTLPLLAVGSLHNATGRRSLGHLGHLGHGFKLQAGASMAMLWVIWVICFLLTQMTQMTQMTQIWRPGALGLWVIWVILSRCKNRRG